jgi:hypothetical protein
MQRIERAESAGRSRDHFGLVVQFLHAAAVPAVNVLLVGTGVPESDLAGGGLKPGETATSEWTQIPPKSPALVTAGDPVTPCSR